MPYTLNWNYHKLVSSFNTLIRNSLLVYKIKEAKKKTSSRHFLPATLNSIFSIHVKLTFRRAREREITFSVKPKHQNDNRKIFIFYGECVRRVDYDHFRSRLRRRVKRRVVVKLF